MSTPTITRPEVGDLRLSVQQVAQLLGYSAATISRLRRRGDGPPFEVLANGRAAYRLAEVERWRAEHTTAQGRA